MLVPLLRQCPEQNHRWWSQQQLGATSYLYILYTEFFHLGINPLKTKVPRQEKIALFLRDPRDKTVKAFRPIGE